MSAEVKRVVIQIGKKEIELSVEDAKALKAALDGIFQAPAIITIPQPYPVPYAPANPYPWSWPYCTEIICGVGSDGTTKYEAHNQGEVAYLAVKKS